MRATCILFELFCNSFALPLRKCYGKALVRSDANSGKTQGRGLAEQWIGRDVSPIFRILTILPWKAPLHSIPSILFSPNYHSQFLGKAVHGVRCYWNPNAFTPWSSFLSRLPRVCFLQLLLLLSNICQTCHGKF